MVLIRTAGSGRAVWRAGVATTACVLSLTVGVLSLTGCGRDDGSSSAENGGSAANGGAAENAGGATATFRGRPPIRAVTTVGMVADLVRGVGGDRVEVTQVMGSGVDPHMYRVTRDDVRVILAADVVFYNGLMLEGKMADALAKVGRRKPGIAVAERFDRSRLLASDESGEGADPHVWMDVDLWSQGVDAVRDALSVFDPSHAEAYRDAAANYRDELDRLHRYAVRSIGSIPEERRVLITSHDAFNYFGRAYGIEVMGIQGLSTDSEAGLQRINELVDLLVRRDVRAVFVESSVPSKNIEALIEGASSRGHQVRVGGELYSDAMGQQGTYEGTYIGMIDHNVTRVTRGLGGKAPERGYRGRLRPHPAGPVGSFQEGRGGESR